MFAYMSPLKHRTKGGNMPWFLLAMADRADTGTGKSASLPKLDTLLAVGLGKPLKRHLPLVTFLVSIGTCGNRETGVDPEGLTNLHS